MPEYPDITVYCESLRRMVAGETLLGVRLSSPFLLRTAEPPLSSFSGRTVEDVERMGKRIVFRCSGERFLVLHLMIAGRLSRIESGGTIPAKRGLAALDFPNGSVLITEAGTKKRASLHAVEGEAGLREMDPGGLEVFESSPEEFRQAITRENHTLKRALTDPKILSGIGNAYSDEILHRARLSPVMLTDRLEDATVVRLYEAVRSVLEEWTDRLRSEAGEGLPARVTAFREEMAVHGRYGKPCPVCGDPVQRIRYATNETNYCPTCQNNGRLLADRALSRLLKKDWPGTVEELENRRRSGPA